MPVYVSEDSRLEWRKIDVYHSKIVHSVFTYQIPKVEGLRDGRVKNEAIVTLCDQLTEQR